MKRKNNTISNLFNQIRFVKNSNSKIVSNCNSENFYKLFMIVKFAAIFIMLLISRELYGQSKVGTTIGQFLKIEPSSRLVAIGNAGTSLSGEASSAFYNPASLGRLEGIEVQFTYNQWLADIKYNYAIAAININEIGTFAIQLISLNSGDIEITTVEKESGSNLYYNVTNFALGVAYGVMLTDRVSAGIAVNYLQETIYNSSLSNVALNFGVQYKSAIEGLTIGASVSNFGPRASYDGRDIYFNYDADPAKYGDHPRIPAELRMGSYGLPTLFRVGLSYLIKVSDWSKLIVSSDAIHSNDNSERINIGGEWSFLNTFAIRGGYRDLFLEDLEGGLVLGAGVKVGFSETSIISFDYAWADYGKLNKTHRFTVGIHF
ncbi:MAG: PorV/PorQ family protein [Ignavibacteriaceae bacterium]